MSLQDELEPKLAQIEQLAGAWWASYKAQLPLAPQPGDAQTMDQAFSNDLAGLVEHFRKFYVMDLVDPATGGALGGKGRQPQLPPAESDSPPPSDPTAFAHVARAYATHVGPAVDEQLIKAGQWRGQAAKDFHRHFLTKFDTASGLQLFCIKELAIAEHLYREAISRGREGIKFIADGCIGYLRGAPLGDGRPTTWGEVASAGALILSVAGLFTTGAATLVVGVGGLVLGFVAEARRRDGDEPVDLSITPTLGGGPAQGVHPLVVFQATQEAINRLERMLTDLDESIHTVLEKDLYQDDGSLTRKEIEVPTLGLKPSAYQELRVADVPGDGVNMVVVEIVNLYRAGYRHLPDAAGEYRAALAQLDLCSLPGGLRAYFPRSAAHFNSALERLAGIFSRTADNLIRAGEALCQAALAYRGTEEENEEILRRIRNDEVFLLHADDFTRDRPRPTNAPVH